MIHRTSITCLLLLAAGCAMPGASPPLHHPDLMLIDLATGSGEFDSRLFLSYNPNGPVRWNQDWPWKLDLTGVAWDQATTATAITPRHVVMANHFKRGVGKRAVFHDRKGRAHQRSVVKVMPLADAGLNRDIAVGLLDRPLPPSIRCYPVLAPRDDYNETLPGALALVTEQGRRLYFHQIANLAARIIHLNYDQRLDESRRKSLVTGDSGNPSFVLTHGELALIETHTLGGPGTGPFYGSTAAVTALRKAVRSLDPAFDLRTVALDSRIIRDAAKARAARPNPARASPPAKKSPAAPRSPRKRVIPPPQRSDSDEY